MKCINNIYEQNSLIIIEYIYITCLPNLVAFLPHKMDFASEINEMN